MKYEDRIIATGTRIEGVRETKIGRDREATDIVYSAYFERPYQALHIETENTNQIHPLLIFKLKV